MGYNAFLERMGEVNDLLCAESMLGWDAATLNCLTGTVSYNVYRSTDPGFVPSPANRWSPETHTVDWTRPASTTRST